MSWHLAKISHSRMKPAGQMNIRRHLAPSEQNENPEIRRLASTRATTVIGLKLKASYAFTDGKLADSIVVDLLQF
jgi:hypothetical protein